jgi:hypothetical protein
VGNVKKNGITLHVWTFLYNRSNISHNTDFSDLWSLRATRCWGNTGGLKNDDDECCTMYVQNTHIFHLTVLWSNKGEKIDGTSSTKAKNEKCMQNYVLETSHYHFVVPDVGRCRILMWVQEIKTWKSVLNSSDSWQGPIIGFIENVTGPHNFMKKGNLAAPNFQERLCPSCCQLS